MSNTPVWSSRSQISSRVAGPEGDRTDVEPSETWGHIADSIAVIQAVRIEPWPPQVGNALLTLGPRAIAASMDRA